MVFLSIWKRAILRARGGGAAQTVIDGAAQADFRDWRDGDGFHPRCHPICFAQQVEKVGGGLDKIAVGREVQIGGPRPKAKQDFIGVRSIGVQPHRRTGGVMRRKLPRRVGFAGRATHGKRAEQRFECFGREAAGAQQRGVQDVRAVGGRDDDDAEVGLEAVHLDQHLIQRLLAFVVAATDTGTALELEPLTEWLARRVGLPYLRIDPLKVDVGRVADVMSLTDEGAL